MFKKKLIALCISITCLLCSLGMLCGCGPDYTSNFAGTWYAVSMEDASGADLTPVLEQLNSANKYMILTLSDEKDKNAEFDLAGQTKMSGRWKPKDETTCAISFEGYDELPASLTDDGKLRFENNNQVLVLEKRDSN